MQFYATQFQSIASVSLSNFAPRLCSLRKGGSPRDVLGLRHSQFRFRIKVLGLWIYGLRGVNAVQALLNPKPEV